MHSAKITLKFQQKFDGIIWKVAIDSIAPYIALLIRKTDTQQACIAKVNLNTQAVAYHYPTEEWLPDLALIHNGICITRYYPNTSLPQLLGITCSHAETGTLLWSNYTENIEQYTEEGILCYNPKVEPKQLIARSYQNGSPIELSALTPITPASIILPEIMSPTCQQLVIDGYQIVASVKNDEWVITVHHADELVLEDKLSDSALGGDSFFILDNQLVYIKNKQEFKIYHW